MPSATHIPVIRTLSQLRKWRSNVKVHGMQVGLVPTMGALHEGHLNLVRASLARHPVTVVSIFVNPMQFAPNEDLSSYPSQMDNDISLLGALLQSPRSSFPLPLRGLGFSENDVSKPGFTAGTSNPFPSTKNDVSTPENASTIFHSPLVVFAPDADTLYPLKGELQDISKHQGVEVDVRGWGDVLEGKSRPQFFKGVATVCTKLFNIIEPDHAYFGQKDIQQGLLLKILVEDLLLSHPTSENLHILPTARLASGLALSSRNAYLTPQETAVAPVLFRALSAGASFSPENVPTAAAPRTAETILSSVNKVILDEQRRLGSAVDLRLDYVELFDKGTFEPIRGDTTDREMVLAGAVRVGKTRLIDNILMGWSLPGQ